MTQTLSVGVNDALCLHITTGNLDDANDSMYEFDLPGVDGFRTIHRNGTRSFIGAIRGIVVSKEDAFRLASQEGSGALLATQLSGGDWAVPTDTIKIGDRMAIELRDHVEKTLTTRPIKKIEIM